MMVDNSEKWIARAEELLKSDNRRDHQEVAAAAQFATSMLTAFYGSESPQLHAFRSGCDAISKSKDGITSKSYELEALAFGTIANAKAELERGLIVNLRIVVTGEILADLVGMGKEILSGGSTETAKNVAAVMIAVAFEDLLRRMALELAGLNERRPLQDIVSTLKDSGALKGGEVGVAQSFLKFRNDSLHADWANISRPQVESCTAFVEAILLKHFS
jgi:hypothetical protein